MPDPIQAYLAKEIERLREIEHRYLEVRTLHSETLESLRKIPYPILNLYNIDLTLLSIPDDTEPFHPPDYEEPEAEG